MGRKQIQKTGGYGPAQGMEGVNKQGSRYDSQIQVLYNNVVTEVQSALNFTAAEHISGCHSQFTGLYVWP